MKKFKILELFAGCGGLGYGFKINDSFEIKLANDIWQPAKLTYEKNNPKTTFILDDIKNIDKHLIDKYFKDGVDIILGGPPCQGFSMCGTRDVNDERNDLFYEYARIVSITKPCIFIMENVKGILSMKNKNGDYIVDCIVSEFDSIGYNIHYKILNSKYYSVPQSRERVIFVGTRKDLSNNYQYPSYDTEKDFYTVGDALSALPNKNSIDGQLYYDYTNNKYLNRLKGNGKIYNHEIPVHKEDVIHRMSLIPQGSNWKSIPDEFRVGGTHSNAYRRLDLLKPSVTIKHAYKSMIIHPLYNRCLSIREVARLQSFPDDFIFCGNKTSQYQQLANAVPPGLSIALANSVLSYLKNNNLNSDKTDFESINMKNIEKIDDIYQMSIFDLYQ